MLGILRPQASNNMCSSGVFGGITLHVLSFAAVWGPACSNLQLGVPIRVLGGHKQGPKGGFPQNILFLLFFWSLFLVSFFCCSFFFPSFFCSSFFLSQQLEAMGSLCSSGVPYLWFFVLDTQTFTLQPTPEKAIPQTEIGTPMYFASQWRVGSLAQNLDLGGMRRKSLLEAGSLWPRSAKLQVFFDQENSFRSGSQKREPSGRPQK